MKILAIDPGTEQSAYVVYNKATGILDDSSILANYELLGKMRSGEMANYNVMAYEKIACYGMAVGATTFTTVEWCGRFIEAWISATGQEWIGIPRKDVKMHLCLSMRAKDANVRQAIIDRYPSCGGGKTPQIGTKAKPGYLYGVKSHIWSALAVAVTYAETCNGDT